MRRAFFAAALLASAIVGVAFAGDEPDHTKVTASDLGIELVKPMKDAKTGFLVGGKNETALIRKVTEFNGRTLAELEKDMRPMAKSGVGSTAGFLGEKESLLDVLMMDNDYVLDTLGLTHQELARHLHIVGGIAAKHAKAADKKGYTFRYHGRRYKVEFAAFRGIQHSPFLDETKTNSEATLTNLDTGAKLQYSRLVPFMIERYGFYEGKGTRFRVDPRDIVAVFDFLKK